MFVEARASAMAGKDGRLAHVCINGVVILMGRPQTTAIRHPGESRRDDTGEVVSRISLRCIRVRVTLARLCRIRNRRMPGQQGEQHGHGGEELAFHCGPEMADRGGLR